MGVLTTGASGYMLARREEIIDFPRTLVGVGMRLLSRVKLGRFAQTSDLVGAAIFLASGASDFITDRRCSLTAALPHEDGYPAPPFSDLVIGCRSS
jgi:hypothetical protein